MNDRERLLSLLPQAKFPNALLEIILHPMPIEVTAIRAGMSKRRLQAVLLGHDTLLITEIVGLLNALQTVSGKPSAQYLFGSETHSIEDGLDECRQDIPKSSHPAVKILRKLLVQDSPPDAALMAIESLTDYTSSHPTYDYHYRP
jgi:hypothetical protein